jgi:excisionase family DNA binding protein
LLGISRQGVDYLAKNDPTFPAPLAVLSIGRVWERRDVEKWARETLWRPMANTDALPQLLTIDQLAERLGVSIRHIRRLIAERRVPYLKVGWFIRFDPAEIAT